jgi:hypothetical protein
MEDEVSKDYRLANANFKVDHLNPITGKEYSSVDAYSFNENEAFYRDGNEVILNFSSEVDMTTIDVISVNKKEKLETIAVSGKKTSYNIPISQLNIPLGGSSSLLFNVLFGTESGSYPSMKTFSFNVNHDIPSIVSFVKNDNTTVEIKTSNNGAVYEKLGDTYVASFAKDTDNDDSPKFLTINNSEHLQFGDNRNFSFSLWIKSDHDISDPAVIACQDWGSSSNPGWILAWKNGRFRLVFCDGEEGDDKGKNDMTCSESFMDGQWHQVFVTFDRASDIKLYVDATELCSGATDEKLGSIDCDNPININQDGTGSYGDHLGASYKMIKFYDKALTVAEVTTNYNNEK